MSLLRVTLGAIVYMLASGLENVSQRTNIASLALQQRRDLGAGL